MKPMVVSRTFLLISSLLILPLLQVADARSQDRAAIDLPSLFDPREKVPKPDLTSLPRIRFVTTVDFPPFNFIDQNRKLSGFHVDLAREICLELKIIDRCQIEAVAFGDIQPRLEKGDAEVAAAGIRITPDLRQTFDFSRPFLHLPARFIMRKPASVTGREPSALGEGKVGVVTGTMHQAMLKSFFPDLKPRGFADRDAMLSALTKGEIDAVFGDALQLSFWVAAAASQACCSLWGQPYYSDHFSGEGLALMTRRDQPQVTAALDAALVALARNGRLGELYLRYFPNGL